MHTRMMKKSKIYQKILIFSLIFLIILYTVCNMFLGKLFLYNMVVGFIISVGNFLGLVFHVKKSFSGSFMGIGIGNSFFRLMLVGVFLYMWFKFGMLNIWGLLVGLSVLTIAMPIYVLIEYRRKIDGTST